MKTIVDFLLDRRTVVESRIVRHPGIQLSLPNNRMTFLRIEV